MELGIKDTQWVCSKQVWFRDGTLKLNAWPHTFVRVSVHLVKLLKEAMGEGWDSVNPPPVIPNPKLMHIYEFSETRTDLLNYSYNFKKTHTSSGQDLALGLISRF